jgi:hypothetical protein
MTEAERLQSGDPRAMLVTIRDRVSDRKLRLAACACCRAVWPALRKSSRKAVEVAEQLADGPISEQIRDAAARAAIEAACTAGWGAEGAADMAYKAVLNDGWYAADWTVGYGPDQAREAALLREVFGPLPFRVVSVPPSVSAWNDRHIVRLAQAVYDERRWGDMPVLGDALLDAGCDNDDMLAHCRQQGGVHVRGCWVIDLLLGNS